MNKLGQVMLYVNNPKLIADFWVEKMGFTLQEQSEPHADFLFYRVTPSQQNETSLMIYDRAVIEKMQPELNLQTPSLLFYTDDITAYHQKLANLGVAVSELSTFPTGEFTFNFPDPENNYYAYFGVE